ncbi:unnamed protein product [Moneuplotes crassus]|uniref:Uncharacterized protein n=1 Tax=Euplotes crassus TaxID=5936 RepID=A0AAD1XRD3_EUPCR|nr:unnamed protein product [Moneuplotes crassus]
MEEASFPHKNTLQKDQECCIVGRRDINSNIETQANRLLFKIMRDHISEFNADLFHLFKLLEFKFEDLQEHGSKTIFKFPLPNAQINCLRIVNISKKMKYINQLLDKLKINQLKEVVFHCAKHKITNFGFYIARFCKVLSTSISEITIQGWALSHKQFCRILASCSNKLKVDFIKCGIKIKNLDCLKDCKPSIKELKFDWCIITQEEEDPEYNNLIEKIAFSSLQSSLKRLVIIPTKDSNPLAQYKPSRGFNINGISVKLGKISFIPPSEE